MTAPESVLSAGAVDVILRDGSTLVGRHEGKIVALVSYARLRDPLVAEVAFAVADELQGRGVGSRLLERLAERAARRRRRAVPRQRPRRGKGQDKAALRALETLRAQVIPRALAAPSSRSSRRCARSTSSRSASGSPWRCCSTPP
jgi:GNAT superfamily N-acetyltransferase